MTVRRPSFQFYPADWISHAGLRMCSVGARGLWMDMLCLMHAGEPYGYLMIAGRPLHAPDLARRIGETPDIVAPLLSELASLGVFQIDTFGTMYSPRMVRDEALRNARAAGGPLGGKHGKKGASHGSKGGRPKNPPSRLNGNPPSSGDMKTPPFRAEEGEEEEEEDGYQGRASFLEGRV